MQNKSTYSNFAKVFTRFAQISTDFARIFIKSKVLGVQLHPLHPRLLHQCRVVQMLRADGERSKTLKHHHLVPTNM